MPARAEGGFGDEGSRTEDLERVGSLLGDERARQHTRGFAGGPILSKLVSSCSACRRRGKQPCRRERRQADSSSRASAAVEPIGCFGRHWHAAIGAIRCRSGGRGIRRAHAATLTAGRLGCCTARARWCRRRLLQILEALRERRPIPLVGPSSPSELGRVLYLSATTTKHARLRASPQRRLIVALETAPAFALLGDVARYEPIGRYPRTSPSCRPRRQGPRTLVERLGSGVRERFDVVRGSRRRGRPSGSVSDVGESPASKPACLCASALD